MNFQSSFVIQSHCNIKEYFNRFDKIDNIFFQKHRNSLIINLIIFVYFFALF